MHPIKHFITVTKHRNKVIAHCAKAGILWRGLMHDLSKYSPVEFWNGARYYTGDKSPNVGERQSKGYSVAWLHHKGRNRHHFEYWTDYNAIDRRTVPVKMPLKCVAEMFCDRVAASKIYKGKEYKCSDPYDYFLAGRATRFIHPETDNFLERLLKMLRDEGEGKTFSYLKNYLRNNKDY